MHETGSKGLLSTLDHLVTDNLLQLTEVLQLKSDSLEMDTLLHVAVKKNDGQSLQLLLGWGGSIALENADGGLPLHYALSAKIAKILLDVQVDTNAKNLRGQTPLHTAAERELPDVVSLLCEAGSSAECSDDDGQTPVMIAAKQGSAATLEALLRAVATKGRASVAAAVTALNKKGQSALHVAAAVKGVFML